MLRRIKFNYPEVSFITSLFFCPPQRLHFNSFVVLRQQYFQVSSIFIKKIMSKVRYGEKLFFRRVFESVSSKMRHQTTMLKEKIMFSKIFEKES